MDLRDQLERGLAGRYVLERELGRGGMATVWLARDLKHERPVALKVLHPELVPTLGPERFEREIRLAARLQHPHILPVFDSGAAGRTESGTALLYYVMPFVEGESLRDRLRREGPLPLGEALRIAREAAQALQYAHEHGIVHRDVKPENILLTLDGNTLVADFGIARAVGGAAAPRGGGDSTLTATGMIVGTPAYMSPEQATGAAALDARSDIYALGCVVHEMLTGSPPFTGRTPQAVIGKHVTEAPPQVMAGGRPAPAAVARAIGRALAKDPADRFTSMVGFAQALATEAAPRRRLSVGVVAAGLALAALVVGVYLAARRGASAAAAQSGAVASALHRTLAQVTAREGVEGWPAWSPEGRRLAYAADLEGYQQLVVRALATGEERRLTRGPRDDIQPAWSPDGRSLAFVRAKTASGKLEPSDIYGWYYEGGDVWAVDVASGTETRLVADAFDPAWSPDGTRLAVDAPWAGPLRIWIVDARGRNPRQVTSDSSEAVMHATPRWSPDGSKLVFRRIEKAKSDIVVVDITSQALTPVTDDNVLDLDPVWAPDGRYIYFTSARGGGLNIWRAPVDRSGRTAGALEQLTTGAGDDVQATIAPDGRRAAFAVRGINADLWRLPVSPETGQAAGEPEPLASTTRVESRGAWSPDGRAIAFNSDRLGEMNLWIRTLADGSERRLTSGPGGDYQPEWSPDGKSIVFFSARAGHTDVWVVSVADGKLTRLTTDAAMDINPFYSPDGRRIAFVSDRSGRSEVWLMNADGSEQRRLTSVGVWGHFVRWTRDGRGIVFRSGSASPVQIFRASVEDSGLTPLPEVQSGGHMSFSPSEAVVIDVRDHRALWAYPADGRPPYRVFEFPDHGVRIDYPVWSPDGRWVLFDRAAPRGGDVWILEGVE